MSNLPKEWLKLWIAINNRTWKDEEVFELMELRTHTEKLFLEQQEYINLLEKQELEVLAKFVQKGIAILENEIAHDLTHLENKNESKE